RWHAAIVVFGEVLADGNGVDGEVFVDQRASHAAASVIAADTLYLRRVEVGDGAVGSDEEQRSRRGGRIEKSQGRAILIVNERRVSDGKSGDEQGSKQAHGLFLRPIVRREGEARRWFRMNCRIIGSGAERAGWMA